MKKIFQNIIIIIGIVVGLQSCSFPEVKQAKFERDSEQVINDLIVLGNFEDARVNFSASSFKGEATNLLSIQLINGTNLNEDASELRNLGREALKILVNSIENEDDYDRFQVIFVQKESEGLVNNNINKPYEYKLEELE